MEVSEVQVCEMEERQGEGKQGSQARKWREKEVIAVKAAESKRG